MDSALTLLVAQVLADDHDATVAADHLALVTDLLDAGLDLHGCRLLETQPRPRLVLNRGLLVAVDDAPAGQVVRRELHDDPVLGEDPDVVLTHLAADVREDPVSVLQLHAEHRVRQGFDDPALYLDRPVLLGHGLRVP